MIKKMTRRTIQKTYPILCMIAFALTLALFFQVEASFAEDEADQNTDPNTEIQIRTIAGVLDHLDPNGEWEYADELEPAVGTIFTEEFENEKARERIDKEESDLEKATEALAAKEAEAFASELLENGRYKELMGYDHRYEMPWDVDEEDEDWDEDDDWDEEYKYVHDSGPYYGKILDRYPHLDTFWFDESGKYHYEYLVDYDTIDYSDLYYYIAHDTFSVKDRLEYQGLTPGTKYTAEVRLVKVKSYDGIPDEGSAEDADGDPANDQDEDPDPDEEPDPSDTDPDPDTSDEQSDPSDEEPQTGDRQIDSEIKKVTKGFVVDESGRGSLEIDFGNMKLPAGEYVFLTTITSEDGSQVIKHDDVNNMMESIDIYDEDSLENAKAATDVRQTGTGQITFPQPKTGDSFIPLAIVFMWLSGAIIFQRYRCHR